MNEIPQGPFCQSCGMPMSEPEHFGTEKDGSNSEEYCSYCYLSESFMDGSITLRGMIEYSAQKIDEAGIMPYPEARKMTGGVPFRN